jgi:hypothetical protein
VIAVGGAAHVAIAASPATTATDYYIPSGTAVTLAMTKASNRVVGVTTGTSTIVTFAEGTQAPFGVGDYISLTANGQSYYDFSHQRVASVDTSSGLNGYFQGRITVSYNSSGILTAFAPTDATAVISQKIAAFGAGSGALYYQQVQITNQA